MRSVGLLSQAPSLKAIFPAGPPSLDAVNVRFGYKIGHHVLVWKNAPTQYSSLSALGFLGDLRQTYREGGQVQQHQISWTQHPSSHDYTCTASSSRESRQRLQRDTHSCSATCPLPSSTDRLESSSGQATNSGGVTWGRASSASI